MIKKTKKRPDFNTLWCKESTMRQRSPTPNCESLLFRRCKTLFHKLPRQYQRVFTVPRAHTMYHITAIAATPHAHAAARLRPCALPSCSTGLGLWLFSRAARLAPYSKFSLKVFGPQRAVCPHNKFVSTRAINADVRRDFLSIFYPFI